jgi:hypothetical protein
MTMMCRAKSNRYSAQKRGMEECQSMGFQNVCWLVEGDVSKADQIRASGTAHNPVLCT